MNPSIGRTLGGFHNRVSRCLVGIQPKQDTVGRWRYSSLDAYKAAVGLDEVDI